jgi:hypothetical protein
MTSTLEFFRECIIGRGHRLSHEQMTALWFTIISGYVVLGPQPRHTSLTITIELVLVAAGAMTVVLGSSRRSEDVMRPGVSRPAGSLDVAYARSR